MTPGSLAVKSILLSNTINSSLNSNNANILKIICEHLLGARHCNEALYLHFFLSNPYTDPIR